MVKIDNLGNALSIVREMRERTGNARHLYTENMFLVANSEALGWLEHYLTEIAEPDDYERRVQTYEAEGMTRSDAQAVVDAENLRKV